jgi:hypothetical protein
MCTAQILLWLRDSFALILEALESIIYLTLPASVHHLSHILCAHDANHTRRLSPFLMNVLQVGQVSKLCLASVMWRGDGRDTTLAHLLLVPSPCSTQRMSC